MEKHRIVDEVWRRAAKTLYQEEGRVEVDGNAQVSHLDDESVIEGLYVQAWVFVPKDAALAANGGAVDSQ